MRLLHVTDFHFHKPWYRWLSARAKEFDVVCLSGDWVLRSGEYKTPVRHQALWCRDWLAGYPGALVGCTGNHDWWTTKPPLVDTDDLGRWLHKARRPGLLLDEEGVLGGHAFHGAGWGDAICLYPSEPVVVLAHQPPHGYPVAHGMGQDGGDVDVMDTAGRLPAGSLVLSGHIHEPKRWCSRVGDAWCFNPGYAADAEVPNHVVVDTERRVAFATLWGREMPPKSLDV